MDAETAIETFIRLIRKESFIYYKKFPHSYLDYEDFFDEGMFALAGCLREWEKPEWGEKSDHDQKAYFKTSMYNAFKTLLTGAFSKKRTGEYHIIEKVREDGKKEKVTEYFCHEVKYENVLPELFCNGFEDVLYDELVSDLEQRIDGELPKKIFLLLADPPKDLIKMAVTENRRKMKRVGHCRGKNTVQITNRLVIKFLNGNGHPVSGSDYYDSLRYIRMVVGQSMHVRGY